MYIYSYLFIAQHPVAIFSEIASILLFVLKEPSRKSLQLASATVTGVGGLKRSRHAALTVSALDLVSIKDGHARGELKEAEGAHEFSKWSWRKAFVASQTGSSTSDSALKSAEPATGAVTIS